MKVRETSSTPAVSEFLQRVAAELSSSVATLDSRKVSTGTVFELVPKNPDAARCIVHTEDEVDLIDFSFADSPTWELPYESRYDSGNVTVSEVEELCRAVIAGNCELDCGLLWVTGRIYVSGYTYKVTDVLRVELPLGARHYAPYLLPLVSNP